jgi:hypothetical protein
MKFTAGFWLKVFLAISPAVIGSFVTYFLSKDKAAGGYTKLSESVNELQGAVEQLRLQVEHIQDLHFTNQPASAPASAPANTCVAAKPAVRPVPLNLSDLLEAVQARAAETRRREEVGVRLAGGENRGEQIHETKPERPVASTTST